MKATLIKDANVLVPNKGGKNFCHKRQAGQPLTIPKDTEVEGNIRIISGLRASKPFDYKIFQVTAISGKALEHPQFIYLNNIKPMQATDVQLGADSSRSATIVNLPSNSMLGFKPVAGLLVGGAAGFYYAKKKNKHKATYTIIGCVGGYLLGKWWQSASKATIKASK